MISILVTHKFLSLTNSVYLRFSFIFIPSINVPFVNKESSFFYSTPLLSVFFSTTICVYIYIYS